MPNIDPSSFRDPSGYVFHYENILYRSVHQGYADNFNFLTESGLADKLFASGLLVRHEVVRLPQLDLPDLYTIIKPDKVPLISYPYEWSFSQLKEAALLTLELFEISMEYGMILKDASAYNIQFNGYKPVFIDTLSFAKYDEGQAWLGYKQFCEHFLAPLCLSSYLGVAFQYLSKLNVDGVPLKMASKLLPWHTWLKVVPLFHIHLHAKSVDHYSSKVKSENTRGVGIKKENLLGMINHLKDFVADLKLRKSDGSQWQHYDKETHYSDAGKDCKAVIIRNYVTMIRPKVVWDMGANDGFFSRVIADHCKLLLSLDFDPLAIEKNFNLAKAEKKENVYSLLADVVNPSPDLGWANQERRQLIARSKPDLIMALALIHHLVITHNISFVKVAEYFASMADWLIIEFVPKDDEKINALPETAGKGTYSRENFEIAFFQYYNLIAENKVDGSQRSILFLEKIK